MPNKSPKSKLHPRNKHKGKYDFRKLIVQFPALEPFVLLNKYGNESIDFFDPLAVRALNAAILKTQYRIKSWEIPKHYLCPPIPGRADYIHYVADLLAKKNKGNIPRGSNIKCLDVGVGANCIYPLIGAKEYGWSFVGSDIDSVAIESAQKIIEANDFSKGQIELRQQLIKHKMFKMIIKEEEQFHVVICNPPFHSSKEAALKSTQRKLKNLKGKKDLKPRLNFGGSNQELWCKGGELAFIKQMIKESKYFAKQVVWFTTLVSKETHVRIFYKALQKIHVKEIVIIEMGQGNKKSRILAWRFY